MKPVLALVLQLSLSLFLATTFTPQPLAQSTSCQDFVVNFCDLNGDDLIETVDDVDDVSCQRFCSEVFEGQCQFFAFDKVDRQCYLYRGNEGTFLQNCRVAAGPVLPDVQDCPDPADQCRNFIAGYCRYLGNVVQTLNDVTNEEMCQVSCRLQGNCQYFVYDKAAFSCELWDSADKVCEYLFGPLSPDVSECGFEFTTSSSGTTSSTITTTRTTTSSITTTTSSSTSTSTTATTTMSSSTTTSVTTSTTSTATTTTTTMVTTTTTSTTTITSTTSTSQSTSVSPQVTLTLTFFDSGTNFALANVDAELWSSTFNTSSISDANGQITFRGPLTQSQTVQVIATLSGYQESTTNLTIGPDPVQSFSISLSPVFLPGQETRVVLNWKSEPKDLDLHAVEIKPGETEARCEVTYFNNCTFAFLDVDNNQGGDKGAETITINKNIVFVYTIFVELYQDGSSDVPLPQSGAQVALYRLNMEPLQVRVPTEDGNDDKLYWLVGCYDSRDKSFRILNQLINIDPILPSFCVF